MGYTLIHYLQLDRVSLPDLIAFALFISLSLSLRLSVSLSLSLSFHRPSSISIFSLLLHSPTGGFNSTDHSDLPLPLPLPLMLSLGQIKRIHSVWEATCASMTLHRTAVQGRRKMQVSNSHLLLHTTDRIHSWATQNFPPLSHESLCRSFITQLLSFFRVL